MLSIKTPVGANNFMQKGNGKMVSGWMGKYGPIRGVTLQPHPALTSAPRVNTLERK